MNTNSRKYSYKHIWTVTLPVLIGLVMEQMLGMTDTMFLGRVGEVELGAAAIAGIYYLVIYMIGFGFSIGAQIIIGRRNGEGNYGQIGRIFWHGVYFLMALALIMVLLSEWLSPKILGLMVSSPAVLTAALSYVKWRVLSLFFAFGTAMFQAFYIGTTQTKVLTFSSLTMVISNFGFNWVLIFGHFGIPALGIEGAAIGSTLSEIVSVIFLTIYTLCQKDRHKYGMNIRADFDWKELIGMMSISGWTMIQNFLSVFTWLIFFTLAEHLGEKQLAISNIIRNISGVVWMIVMAFATTGSTMTSNIIGEGHPESVIPLLKRIMKFCYMIVLSCVAMFCIFPTIFIRLFTNIPDLIAGTVPAMLVMCISYLLSPAASILFQAVAGTGNTKKAFILEVIALTIYMGYCILIMSVLRADIAICWSADTVYALATVLLCGTYIRSRKWMGKTV
jgi:MATE family multidrug resistance protein